MQKRIMQICALSLAVAFAGRAVSPKQTTKSNEQGTLTVTVADEAENAPIRNAFVYIHGGQWLGDTTPTVNKQGHLDVSLAPGLYDIFIASGGFKPTCAVISIEANKATTYNATLSPDNEHLQQ